jgi:hypothetical protein
MEQWKTIEGYSKYKISSDGRIWSNSWNQLMGDSTSGGYKVISLYNDDGVRHTVKIHRLVALAFIPNPDDKPEINHINGVKSDNRIENLEWVNRSENQQHARKNGLNKSRVPIEAAMKSLKKAILASAKKCSKKVQLSKEGTVLIFNSGSEASKYINANSKAISTAVTKKQKVYGWTAQYIQ